MKRKRILKRINLKGRGILIMICIGNVYLNNKIPSSELINNKILLIIRMSLINPLIFCIIIEPFPEKIQWMDKVLWQIGVYKYKKIQVAQNLKNSNSSRNNNNKGIKS